jgi:hypothetical protein
VVPCSSLVESGTALVALAILFFWRSKASDWDLLLAFGFGGGGFFTVALAVVGLGLGLSLSCGDGLGAAANRISWRTPAGR